VPSTPKLAFQDQTVERRVRRKRLPKTHTTTEQTTSYWWLRFSKPCNRRQTLAQKVPTKFIDRGSGTLTVRFIQSACRVVGTLDRESSGTAVNTYIDSNDCPTTYDVVITPQ
jgi:hypothetical protein